MPATIYDKPQQQIKAKKQTAEQKVRMEKVASQKAAAESDLRRLLKK